MHRISVLVAVGCLALSTPRPACAQGDASAGDNARIHLGPLGLKPRISLNSLGVDTNVQNDATNPEHDFTMTLVPGVDTFLPIGRGLLSGKTSYELLYFMKNAEQRAANLSQTERFDLSLTRFMPYFMGEYGSTNQRPNPEIDTRVHQTTKTIGAGASAKVGGRTSMGFDLSRRFLGLDHDTFQGVDLAGALDHRSDTMSASFERALTPLTSFSLAGSVQHDRFPTASIRNTDIVQATPSLQFKPSALISGQASVGYMRFKPLDPNVPGYSGVFAAVDLTYIMRDWTKFGFKVDRSVSYSFDVTTPYYVVTGAALTVAQTLGGPFDVVGRFGRQYLNYRQIATAGAGQSTEGTRLDRTVNYGAGIGYRVSDDTRIGFNVDYDRRMSPVERRQYDGYRFGGTVTYVY